MDSAGRSRNFFAALAVISVALTASCTTEVKSAPVAASVISGDWVDAMGGRISLREDRSFSASDVSWGVGDSSCPDGKSQGSWAFWQESEPKDFISASESAKSGNSLALSFDGVEQGGCYVTLNLIDGGAGLCVTDDVDVVCSTGSEFRRPK